MTRELWDARAALGDQAGTQDRIAKELAMRELRRHIHIGQTVLDVGCGNGQTIEYLLNWEPTLRMLGIDFSPAMIAAARERCGVTAVFSVWDLLSPLPIPTFPDGGADVAITERVLINLGTWKEQTAVIRRILDAVKPGGLYLMIENSFYGFSHINFERERRDLLRIQAPAHNRYLIDDEIEGLRFDDATLQAVVPFSGLYYFLSRIVNARIAADNGKDPEYNSPLNRLALDLPTTSFPHCAQGKLWIWRKHE